MWMPTHDHKTFVNMALIAAVNIIYNSDLAAGSHQVKAWEKGKHASSYVLFVGTEAACQDYLTQLMAKIESDEHQRAVVRG